MLLVISAVINLITVFRSVDHQEERLQIRKDENRIDQEDLNVALGTNIENS